MSELLWGESGELSSRSCPRMPPWTRVTSGYGVSMALRAFETAIRTNTERVAFLKVVEPRDRTLDRFSRSDHRPDATWPPTPYPNTTLAFGDVGRTSLYFGPGDLSDRS